MSSMCFITINYYDSMQDEENCTEPTTKNSIWKSHSRSSWNGFWGKIVGRQKKRCITCTEKTLPFVVTLHIYISTILPLMSITWILQEEKKNKHLIQEIESKRIWKELLWAPSAWIWRAHTYEKHTSSSLSTETNA